MQHLMTSQGYLGWVKVTAGNQELEADRGRTQPVIHMFNGE